MIPWRPVGPIEIAGVAVKPFLLLTLLGVAVGLAAIVSRARPWRLPRRTLLGLGLTVAVCGFVGAHLFALFCYRPELLRGDPWIVLRVWYALSAFGGFIGGTIGALAFAALRLPRRGRWAYFDALAFGLPFGWFFGRAGCALVMDHPGTRTDFFLAFEVRPGVGHHNLGFYEMIVTVPICVTFWWLRRRPPFPGFFVGVLAVTLSTFRLATDHLRLLDVRHLGLTPGHYAAAVFLVAGIVILLGAPRRIRAAESAPLSENLA